MGVQCGVWNGQSVRQRSEILPISAVLRGCDAGEKSGELCEHDLPSPIGLVVFRWVSTPDDVFAYRRRERRRTSQFDDGSSFLSGSGMVRSRSKDVVKNAVKNLRQAINDEP